MRVFHGFDNLPAFCAPIVTVGSYDGVHAGHRVLLGRITEQARANGAESVVVTFAPHPRMVLEPLSKPVPLLNSLKEKVLLLSELGVDNLIVAPFTREFSMVSSYDFVHDYLIGRIGVATLVVGYNHHFGHNKEGNFNYLYELQGRFGFEICEIPCQDVDNGKVSSTVVRRQIADGDMTGAAHSLARPYFMIARAVGGRPLSADGGGTIAAEGCVRIVADDPAKLLPREGTYPVEAAGEKLSLTICGDELTLSPVPRIAENSDFILDFL